MNNTPKHITILLEDKLITQHIRTTILIVPCVVKKLKDTKAIADPNHSAYTGLRVVGKWYFHIAFGIRRHPFEVGDIALRGNGERQSHIFQDHFGLDADLRTEKGFLNGNKF